MNGLPRGIWEFVVGDDWRLALGVVVVFGLTAVLATFAITAWWVAPALVPLVLFASLRRALRRGD